MSLFIFVYYVYFCQVKRAIDKTSFINTELKKLTLKQKKHLLRRSKYQLKKKKRKKLRSSSNSKNSNFSFINLKTPSKFKLEYEFCEDVIRYINKIKALGGKNKNINIIMDDISDIGEGAISMLLSIMEELGRRGIYFTGTKPKNTNCKAVLEKSGFFKFVNGKIDESNSRSKNTILNTGDNATPQSKLKGEIVKSMETVWGQKGRCPSVYSCVFEMIRNSCDHAFKESNKIIWHFALSHSDIDNTVKFSFLDNGKGIIKRLKEGVLKNVLYLFKNNLDIIETAFEDGIESRTGLSWRGKGLPTIFDNYSDNNIKNLVVISNNVYIRFNKKGNIKKKLENTFSGTYYYWEIDKTCKKECFPIKKQKL